MQNKIVTVFGGSGFLGRSVIQRLAQRGARVRVAVRNTDKANHVRIYGDVGQVVPLPISLIDQKAVEAGCAGAHSVINLTGRLYEQGSSTFEAVHVKGPEVIAKACAKHNVKHFVHLSALGADNTSLSRYLKTKEQGEILLKKAFPNATILRPSLMFGPGDGFFTRFADLTTFLPCLTLFNKGLTRFQPVYVGDVADAVVASLERPEALGKIYELGGAKIYSFKELMMLILRYTNRQKFLVPVPDFLASIMAKILQLMPNPLLTTDQLQSLKSDNVVSKTAKNLKDLGIDAAHLEAILPGYLMCYKSRF